MLTSCSSSVILLVLLNLSLCVGPLTAQAQLAVKVPRIGYLGDMPGPFIDAFREGLRELGYIEGQNLAVEYRWAEGHEHRLPSASCKWRRRRWA